MEIAAPQRPRGCGKAASTHRSLWLFLSQPWTDGPTCVFAGRGGYEKKKKNKSSGIRSSFRSLFRHNSDLLFCFIELIPIYTGAEKHDLSPQPGRT